MKRRLQPFIVERWSISEEIEENGLKMRTGKPWCNGISGSKNRALRNDGVVDFRTRVVTELNRRA